MARPALTAAPDRLVVASYNVRGCVGLDGRWNPSRVAAVIGELGADLVAIQELHQRGPDTDELGELAESGPYELVRGPTHVQRGGPFGNGLLTRLPIEELRTIDLSQPGREPRGAIDVEVQWGATRVRLVATHLGLEPRERSAQCRLLLDRLTAQHDADVSLLLGDFNEWWVPSRLLAKLHRHFGYARAVRTFPSPVPLLALDRIWAKPASALTSLRAHRSRRARIASDHLPLRAVIERSALESEPAQIVQRRAAHG
jgi:endonuclease/exonuclease/phosphatase family metal-dependent hydrolase